MYSNNYKQNLTASFLGEFGSVKRRRGTHKTGHGLAWKSPSVSQKSYRHLPCVIKFVSDSKKTADLAKHETIERYDRARARKTRERKKMGTAVYHILRFVPPCVQRSRSVFHLHNANFSQAVSGGHVVRLRKSRVVEDSLPEVIHGASLGHDNLSTGKPAVSCRKRGQVRPRHRNITVCTKNERHKM